MRDNFVYLSGWAVVVMLGCGGGSTSVDASTGPDAATQGTMSTSWTMTDESANPLTCDELGATTVSLSATPVAGGSAVVDSFSCSLGQATSLLMDAGFYDVRLRLRSVSGTIDESATIDDVQVTAGQDTALSALVFEAAPQGDFTFRINTSAVAGNCESDEMDGGGITTLEIEFLDAAGSCVPTAFDYGEAMPYNNDCAGATVACIENTVDISVTNTVSGPHSLVIKGYKDALECWGRTSQFIVPGGGLSLTLPAQALTLDENPACDP